MISPRNYNNHVSLTVNNNRHSTTHLNIGGESNSKASDDSLGNGNLQQPMNMPEFTMRNGKQVVIIPSSMFPLKKDDINETVAENWSQFFPYLHETINPQPLRDGELDSFIQTLRSIHESVSNIGAASFESEVCRLINAYVGEHAPWLLEGKASVIENIMEFEMLLFKLKTHVDMRMIIEMLYHCIHSVTFEGSNFNRFVLVEAINKYGESRCRPFIIQGPKHNLTKIANKRAKDRRSPIKKSEKTVLGISLLTRLKKGLGLGCGSHCVEIDLSGVKTKVYVQLESSLLEGRDRSSIRTINDVLCVLERKHSSRIIDQVHTLLDGVKYDVTSKQCEEMIERMMRLSMARGVTKKSLMALTKKICGNMVEHSPFFLRNANTLGIDGFDSPPLLAGINNNENHSLLSSTESAKSMIRKDMHVPGLPAQEPEPTKVSASSGSTGLMGVSNSNDSINPQDSTKDSANSSFMDAFSKDMISSKEKDETNAKKKDDSQANTFDDGKTFDARDVGLSGAGQAYEVAGIYSWMKAKKTALVEWVENKPGEYGDERFQWLPVKDINKTAWSEFKTNYIELKTGVSYCMCTVPIYFNLCHHYK